ncbi:MAG: class I SAM-dependent methyltransferase [Planctomycetes bacterium]|nr:class I SAM-dependent methyltransferase [Planctomycetota bacterium]
MPWKKHGYMAWFPSLLWQARPKVQALVERAGAHGRVIDIGAGGRRLAPHVRCIDFVKFPGTDVCGDAQCLPLRPDSIDLAIATGLLEHVADDRAVFAELARVLRPGGLAHVEIPFLQQSHDDPIDCRRFTADGLRRELVRVGLVPVDSGAHMGPSVAVVNVLAYYAATLFEGRSAPLRALSTLVFFAASVALWPLKFLDRFLIDRPTGRRLAFGVYCTARKP